MLKQNYYLMFWLIIGSLLFTSCFSTSSTTIKGYVRDGGGKPISDAEVSFGGMQNESQTKTDEEGFYEVTARHKPAQMLYLNISKSGYATHTDKFPGFMAPEYNNVVELMKTIPRRR